MKEPIINIMITHHNCGFSARKIASMMGFNHKTICDNLKKQGLTPNGSIKQKINIIDKKTAKCSKCKQPKPISEFQYGRKGQNYEYRFSFCNECRRKQSYLNLNNDINKFLADAYNRRKRWAKRKYILFTITKKEFIDLFNKQNGKCFYTEIIMKTKVGEGNIKESLSIDKIIPEKGYVFGNCVLCCRHANTMKSNLTMDELKIWIPNFYDKLSNNQQVKK